MFTASMLITLGKQDLIHSGLDLQFRMLRLFFYITSTFSLVKKKNVCDYQRGKNTALPEWRCHLNNILM